jgi:hypothetical protein
LAPQGEEVQSAGTNEREAQGVVVGRPEPEEEEEAGGEEERPEPEEQEGEVGGRVAQQLAEQDRDAISFIHSKPGNSSGIYFRKQLRRGMGGKCV